MKKIPEYSKVRIIKLTDPERNFDGWGVNQRPPAIGDTGTLIDILKAQGYPDMYVVESSDSSTGITIWLSEFLVEELELVQQI